MRMLIAMMFMSLAQVSGCQKEQPESSSGVRKLTTRVATNANGNTIEQENIAARLKMDNTPGSIKHLYVLSAMSGQVLIYSTVKGKVTSSGKRLTPTSVNSSYNQSAGPEYDGMPIEIAGVMRRTSEVLQDDGTYGSSIEYLFWWDSQGRYHQHYPAGGQIVHISDQPLPIKSVTINMELVGNGKVVQEEEKKIEVEK